ncbi:unnamed protein product [Absidia cylindrospora]
MINFLKGQPSSDLLPVELFAKATSSALGEPNVKQDMLQYGDELGTVEFRDNLASFLTKEYSMPVELRHLCPTSGASFGLQHALSLLTRPNSVTKYCYFQEPTYFLAFDIFRDVGYELDQFVGVPDSDNQGLDVGYFETMLAKHFPVPPSNDDDDALIYSAVLYCVPTHANPTGSILPESQRQRLVQLARKYNVLVVCDDVYDILTFAGQDATKVHINTDNIQTSSPPPPPPPPKRVVAYDLELDSAHPVVISNGSFSKLLAPGCRVGWLECHEKLIQRLGACGSYISGGSSSNFMNQVVNQMLKSTDPELSLHHHVAKVRNTLQERLHKGMWETIQQDLVPLGCDPGASIPQGGYFLWLKLPLGINCNDVQQVIKTHGFKVSFGNTGLFMVPTSPSDEEPYIRLCFAHYTVDTIQTGIHLLAQAIQLCLDARPSHRVIG